MSASHRRDTEGALRSVLDDLGLTNWEFENGKKHLKLRVYLPGDKRFTYFLSRSPSDRRSVINAQHQFRRLLREQLA